jgi:hypothetical protein
LLCQGIGKERVEEEKVGSALATVMGVIRSLNYRAIESNHKIEYSLGARNKEMPLVGRAKTRQDVTAIVIATTS